MFTKKHRIPVTFYGRTPTRLQLFKVKARRFFATTLKVTLTGAVLAGAIYGSFKVGQFAQAETVVEIPKETIAPVLQRIAKAESHNSHFCTDELVKVGMCRTSEKGQVLVRANDNKTIDVGKYQINVFYWGSEASKQGLNLFDEKDNEKMALWIYANKGTGEWAASQSQWRK